MNKWIKLIICIVICQLAGIIGSLFTISSITSWYAKLYKPTFTPPDWLFGPVWLTLYTLMGISLYLVWNEKSKGKIKIPLAMFSIQLVLNTVWSIMFFGFQLIFYGLVEIIIMWIFIALTMFSFYRVSRKASLILVPYIAWVTIATLLNYFVWVLNP
jgi:tryptophan-rich sensory protein